MESATRRTGNGQKKSVSGRKKKQSLAATLEVALDPEVAAKRAKLRYVHDSMPGITRQSQMSNRQ